MTYHYFLQKERPVHDVPASVKIFLLIALMLQLLWHDTQEPVVANAEKLAPPLSAQAYAMSSLGEPIAAAKYLNLWLQAFDNQPGASISFHQLNYPRITQWLDTILALDAKSHYPMLVAAKFNEDPNKYWRWLAHAVITAKHEIKDNDLALKYANALTEKATGENVPYWAKDMKIIVLEDMGEVEAAKILVGALIDSGEITDPYELNFLTDKIATLEKKSSQHQQSVEK